MLTPLSKKYRYAVRNGHATVKNWKRDMNMKPQRVISRSAIAHLHGPLSRPCWKSFFPVEWATQVRRYASFRKIDGEVNVPPTPGPVSGIHLTPFPTYKHRSYVTREIRQNGNVLEVYSPRYGFVPVAPIWLRDMCSCIKCRNQDTAQRQINVFKRNQSCHIVDIKAVDEGSAFQITFGDGHETTISKDTILNRKTIATARRRRGQIPFKTWDARIAAAPPVVHYQELEARGLGELLRKIRVHGFCFVDNTPPTPEATESLLTAIGPIRNTHYGGFYDFTADLSSKDTAYTSESLEPHTDNTYFTEPAGLQALHLLSHTEGSGGESSLVDGFRAAQALYKIHYPSYRLLSSIGVWAHASGNEGISIQPENPHPVIGHDANYGISQVRWNNADRAGLDCSSRYVGLWYDAAARFDRILSDLQNQYWFQLTPGRVLIFDNWRVLHGRAAFTGKRRMCGGYINRDDFISKFRMTNMSDAEIRATTVTG